jgi:hypothetical protein
MPVVYKITYPNNKIYIGSDLTDDIGYFGSASAACIAKDFTPEQKKDFTVRREVLWQSDTMSKSEVLRKEQEFICSLKANDPTIGYNGHAPAHPTQWDDDSRRAFHLEQLKAVRAEIEKSVDETRAIERYVFVAIGALVLWAATIAGAIAIAVRMVFGKQAGCIVLDSWW